jgi:hypothetical protein
MEFSKGNKLLSLKSDRKSYFSYFLLDQKVTKNQGFIKIGCVSNPEVSLAIQGMKDWHKSRHLSLLCIATHMPCAHTSVKNRYPIFLMPVLSKEDFTFGNIVEQRFGS